MFLAVDLNFCQNPDFLYLFLILNIAFKIVTILIPIIVMFRAIVPFAKAVISGEETSKYFPGIMKSIFAAFFIFMLPSLLTFIFSSLIPQEGVVAHLTVCFNNGNLQSIELYRKARQIKEEEEQKAVLEALDKAGREHKDQDKAYNESIKKFKDNQKNNVDSVSISGFDKMFTKETQSIVDAHKNDLNYNNFRSVINSYGGFANYVKSLGGVFSEFYGKNVSDVKCASDLQRVSEYVFGFMTMYGFDYYSGSKYCKWGGNCTSPDTNSSDSFYASGYQHTSDGLSDNHNFDKLISGANEINMTTNCNWTVDMVYYKAGLFGGKGQPSSASSYKSMGKNYEIISDINALRPGDIIHFFRGSIDKNDPNTWGDWYHVAYIGEVSHSTDTIVGYDGGSYLTNNKNYKWRSKISSGTLHGTSNWAAVRVADISPTC